MSKTNFKLDPLYSTKLERIANYHGGLPKTNAMRFLIDQENRRIDKAERDAAIAERMAKQTAS